MLNPDHLLQLVSNTLFSLICHQDAATLVELNGGTLMLCPRCAGLHIGFMFTLLSHLSFRRGNARFTGSFTKWFAIISISFLFAEWLLAQLGLSKSSHESRYLSGLFAGSACFLLLMAYRNLTMRHSNAAENTGKLTVILRTTFALVLGVLFSQLDSWFVITFGLLVAVVFNFFFFIQTLLLRVGVIFSNYKTKTP